jgi:ParB/RepB/Spo0J family partition protein
MRQALFELDQLEPDPDNIRLNAVDADIDSLADDIKAHGLLQPLVVYRVGEVGGATRYRISGGHRRFAAVQRLGMTSVPVTVIDRPGSDMERLDLMASENLQRRQLNPVEEARYYKRCHNAGRRQVDIAKMVGRSVAHVSRYMMLLELDEDLQRRIAAGELGVMRAFELVDKKRRAEGRSRSGQGERRPLGTNVPHFTNTHRCYTAASTRCRQLDHEPALRLGAACGECWEVAIRADAGANPVRINEPPDPVAPRQRAPIERFSDPRDILRRVSCTRCGVGALERPNEQRCTTRRSGVLQAFERHEFPMAVLVDA